MDIDALTGCLASAACLVTQTTSGLIIGMLLFLVAVGLTLIFGVLKVVNFSHGAFYMFGAYFAMTTYQLSGSFLLAMLCGAAGTAPGYRRAGRGGTSVPGRRTRCRSVP